MAAFLFPGGRAEEAVGNIPSGIASQGGSNPFSVRKMAGHSDVRLTTQTYARVQAEALRKAAEVPDRLVGERGT
jgi:hypothetical protein